jgi:hypothetical protein
LKVQGLVKAVRSFSVYRPAMRPLESSTHLALPVDALTHDWVMMPISMASSKGAYREKNNR